MFFSPGSFQGPKVDTKKALLLLDLQNDFVASNGKLPVNNTASFLPRLPALVTKFREQGQIIFVKTIFRQPCPIFSPYSGGYNIMLKNLAEYLRRHPRRTTESTTTDPAQYDDDAATQLELPVDTDIEAFLNDTLPPTAQRCCTQGTKGSDLSSQLEPCIDKQTDMVLVKSTYSLFADPLVVMQLRARLISDLYICGSLSNIGVYATVLDAVQQGFNVTLIEDCLGYRDEMCHVEAMRQMADEFGASGIDFSELMDDLHGLLGDVVPASRYTRTFQLSVQQQSGSQVSSSQRVSQWMDTIESEPEEPETTSDSARSFQHISNPGVATAKVAGPSPDDSSGRPHISRASPDPSPPRKRSTSDRDDTEETHKSRTRRASETPVTSPPDSTSRPSLKKTRRESNTSKNSKGSTNGTVRHPLHSPGPVGHSQSTGHLETSKNSPRSPQAAGRTMSQPEPLRANKAQQSLSSTKRQKQRFDPTYLGPDDVIGESDSKIIHDILSPHEADEAFCDLKNNTAWQKMYHRTGEVPRLVAVQGVVSPDGTIPIYRHPADESPPLLPFDRTIDWLRKQCERLVNHPLNHVLIQYYRNGEDNISEHSDKTLDIVRGSSIVNLSLGAMRTMTLRTKKESLHNVTQNAAQSTTAHANTQSRTTHRVRLPHNSLFILGERTNANWLHSIKADKRPELEKSEEELDFGGERISLTFRNIGTFIDPKRQTIWGQGATCKDSAGAQAILQGRKAEEVGEQMIIGFGKENHLNDSEFNWQKVYGAGFDVVNFEIRSDGD